MLIIHSLNLRYIFLARSEILAIFKGRYVFDKVRGGGNQNPKNISTFMQGHALFWRGGGGPPV